MAANRLSRDNILIQALDLADLPELDQHDRPAATIVTTAFSINWLQRVIDILYSEFPWAATIATQAISVSALNTANFFPTDFILDVRNGIVLNIDGSSKQLIRRNFQDTLAFQVKNNQGGNPTTAQPAMYSIQGRTVNLDVTPDRTYGGTLYYYQMPPVLIATDVPLFPSDTMLVDYILLRALEYGRKLAPGSAMKWLREVEIPTIRTSGIGMEPESDHIPLDPIQFRGARRRPWDWMGTTRPQF